MIFRRVSILIIDKTIDCFFYPFKDAFVGRAHDLTGCDQINHSKQRFMAAKYLIEIAWKWILVAAQHMVIDNFEPLRYAL